MKVLVDTNVYRALRRGDVSVVRPLKAAAQVVVPITVVGELLYGFRAGTRYAKNRAELDAFLAEPALEVAFVSLATAEWYARIAVGLRRKGRPIPSNDIWIAASAMERGIELLSFDEHFAEVDGLAWTKP